VAHKLSWFSTDNVGVLLPKIKKIPKNNNGRLAIPAPAGLLVYIVLRRQVSHVYILCLCGERKIGTCTCKKVDMARFSTRQLKYYLQTFSPVGGKEDPTSYNLQI